MFRLRSGFVLVVGLAMMVMAAPPARAQVTTGTVSGTVKDAQGGVIPGATVTLTDEARGTKMPSVVTNSTGDFVLVNIAPGTYTVEVTMPSFKTLKRAGVAVSPGSRVSVETLTVEIGGTSEVVDVKGEAPVIQANSGERSFTIPTESVENLPIANRSFTALTSLAPGVTGNNRIGGGGGNNIMIDGVSAVDTGSNAILLQMNVESIAEVKVLTSGYQAEYGRSSGLQVTAVTKSGTNRFRGSVYDVERNSDWNSNSKENLVLGQAKSINKQRDWGYSIGGPVGKPGGTNKIFFFYSHEFAPRTQGNNLQRYRVPTALERAGDFSQTYDNNGNLFTAIRDPQTGTNFANSLIPADRIYSIGRSILNLYPLPNISGAGLNYNYEYNTPTETATGQQPALRVDYQPANALRITAKYSGWAQTNKTFLGSLPGVAPNVGDGHGITESKQYRPLVFTMAYTVNYTLNPTTFLEATYGHSQNDLAGCGLAQGGTGPTFCTSGVPTSAAANRNNVGLGNIPMLFPDPLKLNTNYYAYKVLSAMNPPMFQDGRALKTPNFTLGGGRLSNAPPNTPFSGFLNKNATDDISVSVTKVAGRHTLKGGFYNTHSWKAQQQNSGATFGTYNFANTTNNPLDTGFAYSNVLLGVVQSFNQLSTYIEGTYVYNNTEGYIQDNWKVTPRLTFDYGIRFVHQQPQYDSLGQASNFFMDKYNIANAPLLYTVGCTNNAATCTGTNRQAKDPRNGQLLGLGTSGAIGTMVPGTGTVTNGVFQSGQGIADTTYTWPAMGYAPRFGAAYDTTGTQKFVIRGGMGLYFDRPSGNSIYAQVTNPPAVVNATVQNAFLSNLGAGNAAVISAPALSVFEYAGGLPTSLQWNSGAQMTLPWNTSFDISYVGQHAWNQYTSINLNSLDFGATFLPQNQDSTQAPTVLGSNTIANDQMRMFRGFNNINQQNSRGWSTFHSLQFSFQRRFSNGVSFGFNDTWSLQSISQTAARLQHNPDFTVTYRADQADADKLLQSPPTRHQMKANFVWDLPDLKAEGSALKAIGLVLNDWQLSGIWTGSTGGQYSVGFGYQNGGGNQNLTGSPDYGARVYVIGDPGDGCNTSDLTKQFNTGAFKGPAVGSLGLESGTGYLTGCFQSTLDLSLARNIRLPHGRNIQLRVDMFNAPNSAIIDGRNTTMNLSSPSDPLTITNLPYDAQGNVIASRILPNNQAGFGVVNGYQNPRTIQAQIRFSF